jgi:hypothetical protein
MLLDWWAGRKEQEGLEQLERQALRWLVGLVLAARSLLCQKQCKGERK